MRLWTYIPSGRVGFDSNFKNNRCVDKNTRVFEQRSLEGLGGENIPVKQYGTFLKKT